MPSPYAPRFEVCYKITCAVCGEVGEHRFEHLLDCSEVPRPCFDLDYRMIPGLGVVCSKHEVNAAYILDGSLKKVGGI